MRVATRGCLLSLALGLVVCARSGSHPFPEEEGEQATSTSTRSHHHTLRKEVRALLSLALNVSIADETRWLCARHGFALGPAGCSGVHF
ncbi:unnamed protein product [Strongylus vulgaris]|uniref:Secreted protein n=1 Tax=Strongylus vulgaris TaxID=40348 RepID=A0A3P7I7L7_STRVU|nr:unnamed protein product [Strongylus vulgaris]